MLKPTKYPQRIVSESTANETNIFSLIESGPSMKLQVSKRKQYKQALIWKVFNSNFLLAMDTFDFVGN